MTIILFIIILGLLVLVHELGHFLAAKRAGVRVDEFGFGYPPRALTLGKWRETVFTLNWIPFGGFVKIFGENYEDKPFEENSGRHFTQISKKWQAVILAAGVTFNMLFAWVLFSIGFVVGMPASVENEFGLPVEDPSLMIVSVLPGSPSSEGGLKSGDKIISIANGAALEDLSPETVSDFINESSGNIFVGVDRGGSAMHFEITPNTSIVPGKRAIGIAMDEVGILSLPLHKAIIEGADTTIEIISLTVSGIFDLLVSALQNEADLSQITGPVGIIGLVGDASRLGLTYLLTFTALISINLAIINLIPLPALDGGRLLFVVIEAIKGSPLNPRIANITNAVGFALLILLMVLVTIKDISNLF